MEALSPTMEEGRLVKWVKHAGDAVTAGEVLAEVETDKAIMDLVARADGVLQGVSAKEGETIPVGTQIAIVADGEGRGTGDEGRVQPEPTPGPAASAPVAVPQPPPTPPDATRVRASPLARRMAREAGLDLKLVTGSGPGGRVVKQDLAHAPTPAAPAPGPAPAATPAPVPVPVMPVLRTPSLVPSSAYEDVPLTQIRKAIASRLATSLGPVPHFFLTAAVDMERAAEARDALNRTLDEADRVSVNDLVLKATALALLRHRGCNAWFAGDHIRYWNEVHLGMAVAVEDGLITPVIRNADAKPLSTIGREARELAALARARRLQPAQYTGATFSVSNLGMFDIEHFTAVINPPEAGIIAVGSMAPQAVAADGAVSVRRRMRITMSCDHRVIDGATGAAFLKTLKEMLENPLAMLL
jgi:pyruvate dehydrogenase E2 component (dihydrolipoamide acetyltransferase)